MLQDLAVLTGGQVVSSELGLKLASVTLSDLGSASRVVIDKDTTTLIGGARDKSAIEGRCAEIRTQIETTTSDYDREKLEERLARLSGGVAVIHVGAASEAERALEAPLRQIAANSGVDPGVVVDRLRSGTGDFGFDASTGEYVDLAKAGIIDPAKVVRVALENAISVAGALLLTEGTLSELEEEPTEGAPGHGMQGFA